MFMRKRENTAQRTGSLATWLPRKLLHIRLLGRPPPPQSVESAEAGGKHRLWQMHRVLAADATSLSLQVSWHFAAFSEPAPRRSLLPGAGCSPWGIIIQDLSLTACELEGLRFRGHGSLCLQSPPAAPPGRRSTKFPERPRPGRPHGGTSPWAMTTAKRRVPGPSGNQVSRSDHLFVLPWRSLLTPVFTQSSHIHVSHLG